MGRMKKRRELTADGAKREPASEVKLWEIMAGAAGPRQGAHNEDERLAVEQTNQTKGMNDNEWNLFDGCVAGSGAINSTINQPTPINPNSTQRQKVVFC